MLYREFPASTIPRPISRPCLRTGIIRLSDYTSKGKWVLLFSHPADFTPVCTTEFVEFARHFPEFEKRTIQLLGNSVDSVYSHIAWVRNIEQHFKLKVPFPVIADLDQKIAVTYGMVHAEKSAAGGEDLEVTDWYFTRRNLKSAAD